MVRQIFYRTTATPNASWIANNMQSTVVSEISAPTTVPTSLSLSRLKGGDCNNTTCTLPTTADGTVTSYAYSSTGETEFCVIPASLLP